MSLQVYNTLTRKKEEFKPVRPNRVGIYVCGPTVYGHAHLGHAKSYISFDVVVRYLRYLGHNVLYIQNVTDVGHLVGDVDEGEDKLVRQARAEQKHPMQIAEEYTRSYFEDMDALNLLRADISPRATGHISEQIEIIKTLVTKGFAYEVNGSVYFDVSKFAGYGKLSGRIVEEMEAGARVEVKAEKHHAADFALWKKANPEHIMQWPSPWGPGYPGWHIECSAMSMKYLGESFDIHGGGIENQFPHHECEIAQSEGATGKPFVKYWLHNNMVTVDGRKMGKSLGNFITLKDAFKKWPPQVIRFFILQSHYRSTLDFSNEAVEGAAKGLEKLNNTIRNLREYASSFRQGNTSATIDLQRYKSEFLAAMDDDFNTPQAIAVLFELSREVNQQLSQGRTLSPDLVRTIQQLYEELGGRILGIVEDDSRSPATDGKLEADLLSLIVELRNEVRTQKLWSLSDKIRDGLGKMGIVLEDKKEGTSWRKIT
jgi:cysteinyl-tRNA synthetase